jgi:predicted unusual protein kinase regulating ubiquinone biosynthesis (AarF/ABC1/UbiB family)
LIFGHLCCDGFSSLWINRQSWSYVGGISDDKTKYRRRVQAIWVRETLLDLGPTFIKLGQLFSTRADLFPSEYVEELAKLQDKVPAFSYDQVQSIIDSRLWQVNSRAFCLLRISTPSSRQFRTGSSS